MSVIENGTTNIPLYDPDILARIQWQDKKASFRDSLSPSHAGEHLVMRPLSSLDYDKGYLQLLGQLTTVGDVSYEQFLERFESMRAASSTYFVTVIEDTTSGSIVGSGTLVTEQKFIHSAGSRGRIEDIIVSNEYRGQQLGKLLVEVLTLLGKSVGCYKMSLECKSENVKFYEKHGYNTDGQLFMVQRYKD